MNGLLKTITMLICFSVVFQGCEESTTEPVDTTMETPVPSHSLTAKSSSS